jgi:hypothetical protein
MRYRKGAQECPRTLCSNTFKIRNEAPAISGELTDNANPNLVVRHSLPDIFPLEGLWPLNIAPELVFQMVNYPGFLILAQEFGFMWVVDNDKECRSRDYNSQESFQDKNPSPAIQASNTVHLLEFLSDFICIDLFGATCSNSKGQQA